MFDLYPFPSARNLAVKSNKGEGGTLIHTHTTPTLTAWKKVVHSYKTPCMVTTSQQQGQRGKYWVGVGDRVQELSDNVTMMDSSIIISRLLSQC